MKSSKAKEGVVSIQYPYGSGRSIQRARKYVTKLVNRSTRHHTKQALKSGKDDVSPIVKITVMT